MNCKPFVEIVNPINSINGIRLHVLFSFAFKRYLNIVNQLILKTKKMTPQRLIIKTK
jgi:hypothetical protein